MLKLAEVANMNNKKSNNFIRNEIFKKEQIGTIFFVIAVVIGGNIGKSTAGLIGALIGAGLASVLLYSIFWLIYKITGQKFLTQLK